MKWWMPLRGQNWQTIGKICDVIQNYIVSDLGKGWGWLIHEIYSIAHEGQWNSGAVWIRVTAQLVG